ncbi:MAG: flagellar filament capping protein FliD [bacterium]
MNVSFSGLSSGMEWDQIIDKLVKIEARPIKRYEERIEEQEEAQDAFRDLNNRTANLASNNVSALTDPDTFEAMKVSNSHSDVLDASVVDEDKLASGTNEIYVENLASRAQVKSGAMVQDQKMATAGGQTSLSDFDVASSDSLDLTSTDFLQQLKNEVETTGVGNEDIMVRQDTAEGEVGISIDLDSVDNFNELKQLINDPTISETEHEALLDYEAQGHAGSSRDSLADSANWSMEMEYDSTSDKFSIHAAETVDGSDGGRTFELSDATADKGFFQQIGFNSDDNIHTYDVAQSDYGMNLLSADADGLLGDVAFQSSLDGSGTIQVNNTEVSWDASVDSLRDVVSRIDEQVEGVNASYSSATDKVTMEATDTGAGDVNVEDVSGNLANVLNLRSSGDEDFYNSPGAYTSGEDAEVTIDGDQVSTDGNTVTYDGMELNLKQLHTEADNPDNPVELEVSEDINGITEEVGKFIEQYNSIMEFINEKSATNYEDDEEEAGPLANDSMPRNLSTRMAQFVTDRYKDATGSDTIQSATNIGIEQTDPLVATDADKGKLNFDAAKFQEALQENPEDVKKLFTASTEDGDAQDGIATKLESYLEGMTDPTDGLLQTRIDGFDTSISNLEDRIVDQEDRVAAERSRLESKFIQMEKMMSDLNNQQSSLSQSLGGGGMQSLL